MTAARVALLAAATLAAAALAGCGERPQVISYKQGTYQGKPDSPPYDAQFKGSRQEWENAIKNRNQNQNEYKRIN